MRRRTRRSAAAAESARIGRRIDDEVLVERLRSGGEAAFIEVVSRYQYIGMCRHCRRYLAQMRATRRSMHALPVAKPPDAVQQELLRRFRDWHKTEGET